MIYTENTAFEWDPVKNVINFNKHGILFEEAVLVFYDVNCLSEEDLKHSQIEDREYVLGEIATGLIYVTYTIRLAPVRNRIISARKATKNERKEYEKRKRI